MKVIALFFPLFLLLGNVDQQEASGDHHVLIISIDGFPTDLLWDQKAPVPNIRSLAEAGIWANGLQPSNPSLTWANHTSIVTGVHPEKHHLLYNAQLRRTDGGLPVTLQASRDKDDLVAVPTLYDVAFEAGLTTAEINWPATRNAGTLHDSFPDVPNSVGNMTLDLQWDLYEAGILDDMTNFALWNQSSAGRDKIWMRSANYIIENRMPDLLLLHLLNVDSTHHRNGINSEQGFTALALADYHVGEVLRALERAGKRETTNIFVVSDHGFTSTARTILPNNILRDAGLLEVDESNRITGGLAQAVTNGGFAMVYLDDPDDEDTAQKVVDLFTDFEGIYKVLGPEDYKQFGLPHPSESDQVGDILLSTVPGYGFISFVQGDEYIVESARHGFSVGHHGFLTDFDEMQAVFVASGPDIKNGGHLDEVIDIRSIAPTAAYLLGLEMPTADGEILFDLLDERFLEAAK